MLLFQLTFSLWLTNGPAVVDSQKQGLDKLRFKNGNNPCSGRLEVFYNGLWGLVFQSKWSQKNSEVVCRQLRCGSEVTTQFGLNFDSELPNNIFESDVNCNGDEESLSKCRNNNWKIKTNSPIFNHVNIKCSEQVSLSLSGGDHPCEGRVEITYKEKKGIICDKNWDINEANIVCKELQCGTAVNAYIDGEYGKGPNEIWINTLNCSGNEDFIWHCGKKTPEQCQSNYASVVCNGITKVILDGDNSDCTGTLKVLENGKWKPLPANYTFKDHTTNCSQKKCEFVSVMKNSSLESVNLTCSEKLKVSLRNERDTTKECYGTVYASINHTMMPVCSNKWDKLDAQVVCKELDCGMVISFGPALGVEHGIRDYFHCTGNESGLWECGSQPPPEELCRPATVVCNESVKLRFAKGDAWTCAGRIEVSVKGNWESVCSDKLNHNELCKKLECGNKIKKKDVFGKGARTNQDICTFMSELCEENKKMTCNSNEDIGIICEKHKRLQLSEGNNSCSGLVEIFQDDTWKRLRGDLWDLSAATAVCQQLQCGTALSIERKEENSTVPFWDETFRCTSNEKSLFDCQVIQNHLKQNMSASVTCSDTVSVRLDGKMSNCLGYVEVCFGSTCHPLCSDSWSIADSQVICRELKCGNPVEVNTYTETAQNGQSLKSVHCNGDEKFFGHCLFMDNATECQKKNKAYVVCTESVKPRLVDGEHRCSGRVEIFYAGTWQSVCSSKSFNTQFGNALCKQLRCGEYDQSFTYVTKKEKNALQVKKECAGDVKTLSDCLQMSQQSCGAYALGLQCSENMDIILQDSSGKNPCSGRVMIRYQKRLKPVVSMGWNISEATVLCRQLHCGKLLDVKEETGNFHNYKNWMEFQFKCNGNESSIWDCQTYTQNLIINTPVHVTCTDEVNISLKDEYNEDSCSGFLHITKNGTQVRLRGEGLQEQEANVLCKEMNCGSVLTLKTSNLPMPVHSDQEEMVMDHIKCLNNEYKLWQCGKILSGNVSRNMPTMETMVVCEEGFDVDLSYCGGKLIIHGHPNGVCPEGFTKNEGDKVCQKLHCGNMKSFSTEDASPQEKPQVLLNCNHEKELPKCLKRKECPKNKYITLFCTDYLSPNSGVPVLLTTALSIGPILLLAGIVLFVLWLRRRRKQKQPENTNKRFSIQNGSLSDYEDIEDGFPDELPMVRHGLENQPDLTEKEKLEKSSLSANSSYLLFDTDGEMEKRVEQKDTAKGSQDDIAMKETAFDQETQLDEDGDNQMSLELQLQDDYDDVDCINISEQNRSSPQLIEGNEEGEQ